MDVLDLGSLGMDVLDTGALDMGALDMGVLGMGVLDSNDHSIQYLLRMKTHCSVRPLSLCLYLTLLLRVHRLGSSCPN